MSYRLWLEVILPIFKIFLNFILLVRFLVPSPGTYVSIFIGFNFSQKRMENLRVVTNYSLHRGDRWEIINTTSIEKQPQTFFDLHVSKSIYIYN